MAKLLITGGAGFIGCHTSLVLLEAGHDLIILDDFSNSSPVALSRVEEIAGKALNYVRGDIRDHDILESLFAKSSKSGNPIEAVIHFAGLKAVGESVEIPLRYWDVNVCGSRALLAAMNANECRTLIFSSTSTIYGEPSVFPITETTSPNPIHPYAQTKLAVEQMLNAQLLQDHGELQAYAISILSVPTPVDVSAKIQSAFQTTYFPSSPK